MTSESESVVMMIKVPLGYRGCDRRLDNTDGRCSSDSVYERSSIPILYSANNLSHSERTRTEYELELMHHTELCCEVFVRIT